MADFGAIGRHRSREPRDRPALVVLERGDTVEAELRPRGHSRRDPRICSFPPLRLDVRGRSARGTVFQGQDKLKIVVPCRPERPGYEELVLREYLLYRVYALTSVVAYRVRLARVRFASEDGGDAPARWAFLIESDEGLAARVRGQVVDVPDGKGVPPMTLHAATSLRLAGDVAGPVHDAHNWASDPCSIVLAVFSNWSEMLRPHGSLILTTGPRTRHAGGAIREGTALITDHR